MVYLYGVIVLASLLADEHDVSDSILNLSWLTRQKTGLVGGCSNYEIVCYYMAHPCCKYKKISLARGAW